MSTAKPIRRCIPIRDYINADTCYYVIASQSLGGSNLDAQRIADLVSDESTSEVINDFLREGICLPLFFDGDGAFNRAIVVLGELTEQEEAEWIGRISSYLKIPCGRLLLIPGGGDPIDWEDALAGKDPDPRDPCFEPIDLLPGDYLVDVFAYVTSMTVNFHFDNKKQSFNKKKLVEWFKQSRPGERLPRWIDAMCPAEMDEDDPELVSYIVRVLPLTSTAQLPPLPELDVNIGWCKFQFRKPQICPLGIPRSTLLGQKS